MFEILEKGVSTYISTVQSTSEESYGSSFLSLTSLPQIQSIYPLPSFLFHNNPCSTLILRARLYIIPLLPCSILLEDLIDGPCHLFGLRNRAFDDFKHSYRICGDAT